MGRTCEALYKKLRIDLDVLLLNILLLINLGLYLKAVFKGSFHIGHKVLIK